MVKSDLHQKMDVRCDFQSILLNMSALRDTALLLEVTNQHLIDKDQLGKKKLKGVGE